MHSNTAASRLQLRLSYTVRCRYENFTNMCQAVSCPQYTIFPHTRTVWILNARTCYMGGLLWRSGAGKRSPAVRGSRGDPATQSAIKTTRRPQRPTEVREFNLAVLSLTTDTCRCRRIVKERSQDVGNRQQSCLEMSDIAVSICLWCSA